MFPKEKTGCRTDELHSKDKREKAKADLNSSYVFLSSKEKKNRDKK